MVDIPELTIRPATFGEWNALEALFESLPAANKCLCMYWRETRTRVCGHSEENKEKLKAIIASDKIPGLIAYHGGIPINLTNIEG